VMIFEKMKYNNTQFFQKKSLFGNLHRDIYLD
jgi:hypothetical protein